MVTIPTYAPDQVRTSPGSSGRAADLGPEAFGAGVANGLNVAANDVQEAQQQATARQDIADHTAAQDKANQYTAFEQDQLYNPTTGVFNQQGRSAILVAGAAERALADKARELSSDENLTPQAQKMLSQNLTSRMLVAQQTMSQHVATATMQDADQTTQATIGNAQSYASAAYRNPQVQQLHVDTALGAMQDQATRHQWSPEVIAYQRRVITSPIYANTVSRLVDDGHLPTALAALDAHQGDMLPDVYQTLKAHTAALVTTLGASATADAIAVHGVAPNGSTLAPGAVATPPAQTGPGAAPAGAVPAHIFAVVKASGGSPQEALNLAVTNMVEGYGRLTNVPSKTGKHVGPFQFDQPTFSAVMPNGDINNPDHQIVGAMLNDRKNTAFLGKALGRTIAPWETYLAHQQGPGSAKALLSSPPGMSAVDALTPAYDGDASKARQAVLQNGGTLNTTVADFELTWRASYNDKLARLGGSPGTSATAPPSALPDRATYIANVVAQAPNAMARKAYQDAATARYSQMSEALSSQQQQANDAAQPVLQDQSIRTVDQFIRTFGSDNWSKLKPETKTSIQEHYGSGGYAKESDPVLMAGLNDMQTSNTEGFKNLDPTGYASRLSQGDYAKLLSDQKTIREGGGAAKQKLETQGKIKSVSETLLEAAGFGAKLAAHNPNIATSRGQFFTAMYRAADTFRARTEADPNDEQLTRMADTLLLTGAYTDTPGHSKEARGFEAPAGAPFSFKIPVDIRAQIANELTRANGVRPNELQIGQAYAARHARGYYNGR